MPFLTEKQRGEIGGYWVSAADMVLAMSGHQAKMKLMSLIGSISAVADTAGESREQAIKCLIENANQNGLLQQFHLDCLMFDARTCDTNVSN